MSVRTSSFQSGLLSTCTRPSLPQNLPMTSHFRNFKNLTTLLVFRSSFSAAQNSTNKTVYLLTLVFHSSVTAISVKCRRGPEARLARGQWLTASDKKKKVILGMASAECSEQDQRHLCAKNLVQVVCSTQNDQNFRSVPHRFQPSPIPPPPAPPPRTE